MLGADAKEQIYLPVADDLEKVIANIAAVSEGNVTEHPPEIEARLAQAEINVEAIQITEHRVTSALSAGQNPGPLSSMLKTQGTELLQRIEELGLDIAAHYAPAGRQALNGHGANEPPVGSEQSRDAAARYFNSRAASIYGGANEIQRNIMARLVLGL